MEQLQRAAQDVVKGPTAGSVIRLQTQLGEFQVPVAELVPEELIQPGRDRRIGARVQTAGRGFECPVVPADNPRILGRERETRG